MEGDMRIESKRALIDRLKRERDQAVEDLRNLPKLCMNNCAFCVHYNRGTGDDTCIKCGALGVDCWEWRGVVDGGTHAEKT
jgi:hypothetical protein